MANQALFAELPKGSISEIITRRITDALLRGELKPGDKIPTEMEFSEKLKVSRNAVREAVKGLAAFGVLEVRRSEGTFVVKEYNQKLLAPLLYGLILSYHSIKELLEFKLGIAASLLYLAILNASEEEIRELRRRGEAFRAVMRENPVNIDQAYEASLTFNKYLSGMTHNCMQERLGEIVDQIATFTRRKAIEVSIERGMPEVLPDNYLEEVALLERREKESVAQFMDQRLKIWQNLLM